MYYDEFYAIYLYLSIYLTLKSSWTAVEFPIKVPDILRPRGGMSHTAVFTLFGIHSTKADEFLFCIFSICSSTSFMDMRPRNTAATVKYRPWLGLQAAIMFFLSNICVANSCTVRLRNDWLLGQGGKEKGIRRLCQLNFIIINT